METKTCPSCTKTKPVDEFYKRSSGRPQSWCKLCTHAGQAKNRRSILVPAKIHELVKADARRNGLTIAQWMAKAVVAFTRTQCAVPGCLNQAPNEHRLCEGCLRRAGLLEARRA